MAGFEVERADWRGRLRLVCLSLPETVEKPMFPEHCDWRVHDKIFCFGPGHVGDWITVGLKVGRDAMDAMIAADPRVTQMPYIGRHGWVTVDLAGARGAEAEALWDEVGELVRGSYRLVAPRRLARLVD